MICGEVEGPVTTDWARLHGAAALTTRAHLDHLIEQGRVRRRDDSYELVGNR